MFGRTKLPAAEEIWQRVSGIEDVIQRTMPHLLPDQIVHFEYVGPKGKSVYNLDFNTDGTLYWPRLTVREEATGDGTQGFSMLSDEVVSHDPKLYEVRLSNELAMTAMAKHLTAMHHRLLSPGNDSRLEVQTKESRRYGI